MNQSLRLALGSLLLGVLVLLMKAIAYRLTGSVALLSDALESIVNIAGAGAAFLMLRISIAPADANHPYGHSKAEYFSAVFEGVLIVVAALVILRAAYLSLLDLRPLDAPALGLAVNAAASLLNGIWAFVLIRSGRARRSPALVANGRHLLTDVITSVGVFLGVVLVHLTGWLVLDPLIAALVAVNILWAGWGLVRDSVGGLMDEAVAPGLLEQIRATIATQAGGALEAHDIRTRHAGSRTFIEFHLIVPGRMQVAAAHDICDRIEAALGAEIENSTISIHIEPEHKSKPDAAIVL